MTVTEAARLLEVPTDATPAQVQTRFLFLSTRLQEKAAAADTPYLVNKHREALSKLTEAAELLTLASNLATGTGEQTDKSETAVPFPLTAPATKPSAPPPPEPPPAAAPRPSSPAPVVASPIPVPAAPPKPTAPAPAPPPAAKPAPAVVPAASAPPPAARPPAIVAAKTAPAPAKTDSGGKKLGLATILVLIGLLAGGGWWVVRNRAATAERERTVAALRSGVEEASGRWTALQSEAAEATATLAQLDAELPKASELSAPAAAELKARHAAQRDYVAWLTAALADHPAKSLLATLQSGANDAASIPAAQQTEGELRTALDRTETERNAKKETLLALGRPLRILSEPTGLQYTFTDSYGRVTQGLTPATLEAPWGEGRVVITSPGAEWAAFKRTVMISREGDGELKAGFTHAPVRISTQPERLAFELTNSAGLSRRGTSPAELKNVPTGPAVLRVSKPGWPDVVQTVEITPDGPNPLKVEFASGGVTIVSDPAGASVYADGKPLGVTPLTISDLVPGEYRYTLNLDGYATASVAAQVTPRETARASAVLQASTKPEEGKPYRVPELGIVLMPVRAGTFAMGSSETDLEHNDDELQREVTITHSYWLGKYEVTQAEWRALMGSDPSAFKGDRLPVEQVSWAQANEFCRKLTAKEHAAGRLPEALEYALPTEAQWEYACRAGSTRAFGGTGVLDEMGWNTINSDSTTHEVGKKQPNAWGLHDMHGNVWEWCADWFSLHKKGPVTDPVGPASGSARVGRGGGWGSSASSCRSAFRFACQPGSHVNNLGFRLALVSVKKAE